MGLRSVTVWILSPGRIHESPQYRYKSDLLLGYMQINGDHVHDYAGQILTTLFMPQGKRCLSLWLLQPRVSSMITCSSLAY